MIRSRQPLCLIADSVFNTAYDVIVKSGAVQSIEHYHQEALRGGGRTATGINYTSAAALVALLVRFLMGRPYSLRGVMETIGEFSVDQTRRSAHGRSGLRGDP